MSGIDATHDPALHSWVQYFISIFFWPLSFWHPTFTVGQWPAGSVGG